MKDTLWKQKQPKSDLTENWANRQKERFTLLDNDKSSTKCGRALRK